MTVKLTLRMRCVVSLAVIGLLYCTKDSLAADKTWVGTGLASSAANWSGSTIPQEGDTIILDGTESSSNMTWDLDIPLDSWTQHSTYTGTVEIATRFDPSAFDCLEISNNCTILGGTWTHSVNPASDVETFRLQVAIGGDLRIGTNATIDVTGKGYAKTKGPGSPTSNPSSGGAGGSYGGRAGYYTIDYSGPCYGSIIAPTNLGSGGKWSSGGGAIRITVANTARLDGRLLANGNGGSHYGGAGGSIYLTAGALAGSSTGLLQANGGRGSTAASGGGGRIALAVTNAGANFSQFVGDMQALGWSTSSASGTIYLENGDDLPGRGELLVVGTGVTQDRVRRTDLSGVESVAYHFGRLTLANRAVLGVLEDNTLDLEDTVFTLTGTDGNNGIALSGGTLTMPEIFTYSNIFIRIEATNSTFAPAETLTVGENAQLMVDVPYTMAYALTVGPGGMLTHSANGAQDTYKLQLNLLSNLTVQTGGKVDVSGRGYAAQKGPGSPTINPASGGSGGSHGGRAGYNTYDYAGPCYGSIVEPTDLGSGGKVSAGGGAIILTVGGTLQLDGDMLANGAAGKYYTGAGGSVSLTLRRLQGDGVLRADGGLASNNFAHGGGGRIALAFTDPTSSLADFMGTVGAYGGRRTVSGLPQTAAGTIYVREAGQDLFEGRLIVDNADSTCLRNTEINGLVVDTHIGNLILRHGARLVLDTNQTLIVDGIWSNAATFHAADASTVEFGGAANSTSTLFGATTFAGLVCTNVPGKTLRFAADETQSVASGGSLSLHGNENSLLTLCSTQAGEAWKLNVADDAAQSVFHVNVSDSDASTGAEITAFESEGEDAAANNVHWSFFAEASGATNTWLGALSDVWSAGGNWDLGRAPLPDDNLIIPGGCDYDLRLDGNREANSLDIRAGASLFLAGWNLGIASNLTVSGSLIASGTEQITLSGDADFSSGVFTPDHSTLLLTGDAAQTVGSAGLTCHNLHIVKDAGSVAFTSSFAANELRCDAPPGTRELKFSQGITATLCNLVLLGSTNSPNIILRSGTSGQFWHLRVSGYRQVCGVDVRDSDASPGLPVAAASSTNSGNNLNWVFDQPATVWLGTHDSDFHTAANWSTETVPDTTTRVVVDSPQPLVITGAVALLDLSVGGGDKEATVTANAPLILTEGLNVLNNGTLTLNQPSVVSNTFRVFAGGTVTHSANGDEQVHALALTVLGDAVIDTDGKIDVTGKGYEAQKGPGSPTSNPSSGGAGGSHGGRAGYYGTDYAGPCYGSVRAPTTLGSGGKWWQGGGMIRLDVSGALRVDGDIIADGVSDLGDYAYYGGAGGSIHLSAGTLAGAGSIRANGGDVRNDAPGGGGRLAVDLHAGGADFTSFVGSLSTCGGRNVARVPYPAAGAGTIYLQRAVDPPGHGTVTVDNDNAAANRFTDLPPASNFSGGELKRAAVSVTNTAVVRVLDNVTIGDLHLTSANARLIVTEDTTLTIRSREHPLTPGTVDNLGTILWIPTDSGTMIMLR